MTRRESAEGVAYCGLVCAVCTHAFEGCTGCRSGGGDERCYQRQCCVGKKLDGCWQCPCFPCGRGYFAGEEWSGLCVGFVQAIKDSNVEAFAALVRSRLGEIVEYGDYRFKDPQEIKKAIA